MKIKCINNTGNNLLQSTIDLGYSKITKFDFEIGSLYTVYGIRFFKNNISYLLTKGTSNLPFWHPAELFEIINNILQPIFYFNVEKYKDNDGKDKIITLCSYKEMACDKLHHDALIEREHPALDIFYKRKEEIDEFEDPEIKKPISENSYY